MKPAIETKPAIPPAVVIPFRQPIRTYFDPAVNFEVKVYAPGHASGHLQLEDNHGE